MFRLIFKFFVLIFSLGTVTEFTYNYPLMVLDIGLLLLMIFLYYLFRALKALNRKWYAGIIIAGIIFSVINLLPYKANKSPDVARFINQKGVLHVLLKGNIYREERKEFKVKTLKEFISLANIYYKYFFLNYFYFICL